MESRRTRIALVPVLAAAALTACSDSGVSSSSSKPMPVAETVSAPGPSRAVTGVPTSEMPSAGSTSNPSTLAEGLALQEAGKLCPTDHPSVSSVVGCLRGHQDKLSAACKDEIAKVR